MRKQVVLYDSRFYLEEEFYQVVPFLMERGIFAGGSHVDLPIDVENVRYSFWCYASWWEDDMCNNCKRRLDTEIRLEYSSSIPDVFFDWKHGRLGCCKIFVNGEYAGFYCPAYSIFYLSDWTHNSRCLKVAQVLIPFLFEQAAEKCGFVQRKVKLKVLRHPSWKVVIGTDPEFEELRSWGKYEPVPTSVSGGTDPEIEIGRDGAGDQIELRPKPGSPVKVVKYLRYLISRVSVPLSVKGDRYPLGAHIHFSIPSAVKKGEYVMIMCTILDDFLGKRLIDLSGRARGSYKRLGAYEIKPWGFEYRSLPSAILYDPEVARVVFKIAKNLVENFIRRGRIVYNDPPTKEDYRRLAFLTDREWQIFESFVERYSKYDGREINSNWVKGGVGRRKVVVHFRDDWRRENRDFIERLFNKSSVLRRLGVSSIVLYGLAQSRGRVVAGFSCSGFKTIEHPIRVDEFTFGLPWEVRMQEGKEKELRKIYEAIVKKIKQIVVEK